MVTLADARESVYARWNTLWGDRTPFVFENEDDETLDAGSVPWARVTVTETGGGQDSLGPKGGRKYYRSASAFVQIMVPRNSGTDVSAGHVGQVRVILEGEKFSSLVFNDALPREQPVAEGDKWKTTLVEVLFNYEEIK